MTLKRALLALVAFVFAPACKTVESSAQVDDAALAALTAFDYADWAYTLRTYVDDHGKVKYAALAADDQPLARFVATVAKVGPTTRPALFPQRDDQLAYYINAYNALVMYQVLQNYPEIGTVYDGQGFAFFYGTSFIVDGASINLYDLEHEIVRKKFGEPRIHFALNCASESCPRLPNVVFRPEALEEDLAREAHEFVHDPRNVRLDGGALRLSQIFEWYADDFPGGNVAWIRATAPDLGIPEGVAVEYTPYDWKLNDQDR